MDKKFDGFWVVAYSGGKTFIGKVVAAREPEVTYEGGALDQEVIIRADSITLSPAYDFFSPLRPMQVSPGEIGYARDPIVTPLDFAMEDLPLTLRPNALYFFSDMKPGDRSTYEGLVNRADQQKIEGRTKRAGLHLVDK